MEKLIELFQLHGYETESKKLDKLLHGFWTTGSELIGELMLYLETIDVNQPNDVKKLKDKCHYFAKHHRKILDCIGQYDFKFGNDIIENLVLVYPS